MSGSWATIMLTRVLDDLVSPFTAKTEPFARERAHIRGAADLCALPPSHAYSSEPKGPVGAPMDSQRPLTTYYSVAALGFLKNPPLPLRGMYTSFPE